MKSSAAFRSDTVRSISSRLLEPLLNWAGKLLTTPSSDVDLAADPDDGLSSEWSVWLAIINDDDEEDDDDEEASAISS